jgi:uncharacterized membrane protein YeaQ/YmgE (transglycosylase-associated protein family)
LVQHPQFLRNANSRQTFNIQALVRAEKTCQIQKGEYEMGLLSWIVVGLIAGWLANQVMRGGRGNAVTDIIVGILGALVGGFLAGELFGVANAVSGINVTSIVVAFLGAVVAIAIVRALPGRSPL